MAMQDQSQDEKTVHSTEIELHDNTVMKHHMNSTEMTGTRTATGVIVRAHL